MKHFITLIFYIIYGLVYGQNLVTNGSFEDYLDCPDDQYEIDQAQPWSSFKQTPDFFHVCDESNAAGVPYSSIYGYQEPLTGDGQAGFIALGFTDTHEIIGAQLSQNLETGVDYYVSFYVSRGFGGGFHSNCDCAINNVGLKFLTQGYSLDETIPIDNQADILYEEVIVDTVGWTHISGWFTADSAYSHIAIGHFFDVDNTTLENYNGYPFYKTYYFLDEVCISDDIDDCILPLGVKTSYQKTPVLRVYPNPTLGQITINSDWPIQEYTVYDVYGKKVLSQEVKQLLEVDASISDFPKGIYTVSVMSANGEVVQTKLLKQ